jgi:hypothetical protein
MVYFDNFTGIINLLPAHYISLRHLGKAGNNRVKMNMLKKMGRTRKALPIYEGGEERKHLNFS